MASRFSAARPKRAGEAFARQHHGEDDDGSDGGSGGGDGASAPKKVKFDMRNPSALAPDAREADDILEADVIGVGAAATKRGAVNIDGYDSDSDNETFNVRAEQRKADDVNLIDQLDNYDKKLQGEDDDNDKKEEDDDDMFGGGDDEDDKKPPADASGRKKWKEVHFLDDSNIEGQEDTSKSGGHVRLDEASSSDDEDAEQEILEEGVDAEVGPGGLKKHAPKIDAFNMKQEQEEGAFDEAGNYIRKAADPDAVHDRWLEGVSKKQMKQAAEAHQKRQDELREQRRTEDSIVTSDLFAALITRLERGETPLEALARLGRGAANKPRAKRIPKWRMKKQAEKMDQDARDEEKTEDVDAAQAKRKADIDAVTEAADRLLNRDYPEIYETERERLMREYRAETGETWVDPPEDKEAEKTETTTSSTWEYRWTDGRDGGAIQGPYDGPTMQAWQDAGYFGQGIEFRPVGGGDDSWQTAVVFV